MATTNKTKSSKKNTYSSEKKIEDIKDVLRKYFEYDPWTDAPSPTYSETYEPQNAIDDILEIINA